MKPLMLTLLLLVSGALFAGCGDSSSSSGGAPPTSSSSSGAPVQSLSIATASLPNATAGAAYATQLQGSGGTPPYTFGTQANQPLPSGLSLSPDGFVTGTPTSSGVVVVGFTINDSGSPSHSTVRDLQLTVQ